MSEQLSGERGGPGTADGGRTRACPPPGDVAAAFDLRLADVWLQIFGSGVDLSALTDYVACFLRMAYLRGYEDGLCEAERGSLFTSLGLPVPARRGGEGPERKERPA